MDIIGERFSRFETGGRTYETQKIFIHTVGSGDFALPTQPAHYCYVTVPAGTTVYVGVVNQSSVSGTLQYELAAILSESYYGTSILLP